MSWLLADVQITRSAMMTALGGIALSLVVGLLIGWGARLGRSQGGYGLMGDLVAGIFGAVAGTVLVAATLRGPVALVVGLFAQVFGAMAAIWVIRHSSGRRPV